jgi:hypothetical protein
MNGAFVTLHGTKQIDLENLSTGEIITYFPPIHDVMAAKF